MNFALFLDASPVIQFHTIAALAALVLGAYVLLVRKGTTRHKMSGRVWAALMIVVALTAFGIHEIRMFGLFSPIHLLSIVVLAALAWAISAIRQRSVATHERIMTFLFFGGLVLPGLFTLLPERLLYKVLLQPSIQHWFGTTPPEINPVLVAFAAVPLGLMLVWLRRRSANA
jgi:uncharacterized membrane protein